MNNNVFRVLLSPLQLPCRRVYPAARLAIHLKDVLPGMRMRAMKLTFPLPRGELTRGNSHSEVTLPRQSQSREEQTSVHVQKRVSA